MNQINSTLKIKRLISFFIFSSFLSFYSSAQTGSIRGKISGNDKQPAVSATISMNGNKLTAVTNEEGIFILNDLPVGTYRLTISFVGLKPINKNAVVTANQITELNITLPVNSADLKEIIIYSQRTVNERISATSKLPISNMDLPQSVGSIKNVVIKDQQATRVGDVIRNVSGVSLTQTRLGVNETYTARGYSTSATGAAGTVLKNGLISNYAGMPEAATLESVEVMKGSNAMLYGNVSGGLVINLITKKPKFQRGGEVSMQWGSFQQYKPVADLYGPITRSFAYRFVGTYEKDKSFRDAVKTKRLYLNPSLLYNFGKKTSLLVQGDLLDAKLTPDFGIGTLDSGRILPTTIPRTRFINVLWAYNNVKQHSASFELKHDLNENWNFNVAGSLQKTDADSYGASNPNTVSKTGEWTRTLARAHTIENDYTAQANLIGKFAIRKTIHQLLFGADATRVITETDAFKLTSNGSTVTNYDKINILDPEKYSPRADIPEAAVTTTTSAPGNRVGVYVQDFITVTSRIKLMAGVRWSFQETVQTKIFNTGTQTTTAGASPTVQAKAFSPKFAIVYRPVKNTSIFASYANNFTINTGTDIYGQMLQPSIVDQYELGVKNNLFKGKLSANLSLYRIRNNNLAQQAEFKADGTPNSDATVKELKGQTTSDGLEVDLDLNVSKNFYAIAGYGYNNMRFTKTTGAKGSNIEGEQLVINPRNTANATAFYTFTRSAIKGLKLGFAAFYLGKRLGGYNNTVGQTQTGSRLIPLSGFTTVDVSAGYSIRRFSLLAKLSNIFNEENYLVHDNYSITPIAPRQLTATMTYKF